MTNDQAIDLTASSPAAEPEIARDSSPSPEVLPLSAAPAPAGTPVGPPAQPAPLDLRWKEGADIGKRRSAGRHIAAKHAVGTSKLMNFFGAASPVASGIAARLPSASPALALPPAAAAGKRQPLLPLKVRLNNAAEIARATNSPVKSRSSSSKNRGHTKSSPAPGSKSVAQSSSSASASGSSSDQLDGEGTKKAVSAAGQRKHAKEEALEPPVLKRTRFHKEGHSDECAERKRCAQHLAKAIDFVRNLRRHRLCGAAKEHWGSCTSLVLAQLAVGQMSDEAVAAVLTRGSSVLESNPNSQSGKGHHGPGLYLQIVGGLVPPTLYVGKSDVNVHNRLMAWGQTVNQLREHRYKRKPPLIAVARLAPEAKTFAAVELLPLPTQEHWYIKTHQTLRHPQKAAEEVPALDLRNTICSLLEAAFIAAFGTCQKETGYVKEWEAQFGNGMLDVTGANLDTGIKGNFGTTLYLRRYVRDEKVPLRGGTFLERIGSEIFYRDGQKEAILVGRGCDSLKSFLKMHFEKYRTIKQALLTAQVVLALVKAGSQAAEAPLICRVQTCFKKASKPSLKLCMRSPPFLQLNVPSALYEELGLDANGAYIMELQFGWEEGWFPFQRITDSDAQMVEGTVLFLRAENLSNKKKSKWVRFSALSASQGWVALHQEAQQLLEERRKVSGRLEVVAQAEEEQDEDDDEGDEASRKGNEANSQEEDEALEEEDEAFEEEDEAFEEEDEAFKEEAETIEEDAEGQERDNMNSDDDCHVQTDTRKRLPQAFRQVFETMRRGTYSASMTHTGASLLVTVSIPGAKTHTGRHSEAKFTLPHSAVPPGVQNGTESISRYTVFLWGDASVLRYYVKKDAALTERPDLTLFRPLTAPANSIYDLLDSFALLNGQQPPLRSSRPAIPRVPPTTLKVFEQLLAGEIENTGRLWIFRLIYRVSKGSAPKDAKWQWWFDAATEQLHSRRAGTSQWKVWNDNDSVSVLTSKYKEWSAAGVLSASQGQSTAGGEGNGGQAEGSGSPKSKKTADDNEEGAEEELAPAPKPSRKGKERALD